MLPFLWLAPWHSLHWSVAAATRAFERCPVLQDEKKLPLIKKERKTCHKKSNHIIKVASHPTVASAF